MPEASTSVPGLQPSTAAERYQSIDILRGLALFGVLIVNLLTAFRIPLLEHILKLHSDPGWANRLVDLLVSGAIEFKALTIFSFLFGVGVAIQAERAATWDVRAWHLLLRRFAWLFILGAVHLFLIWNGDILALYAVCGLLLLPFLALPWQALFAIGVAAIALPEVIPFGLPLPSGQAAAVLIAEARQIYSSAGCLVMLEFRWREAWLLIVPLLVGILPRTTGLMFLGMAAWRCGILREPERHRRKLLVALALSATAGTAATVKAAILNAPILLALAYTSGLLLWLTPRRASALPGLAAAGRMALTNYLVQSIVLGFVFYGYGLGLFGKLGSAAAASIGLLLYVVQLQLSYLWLRRFRFGPFEWLWRSLTYGRMQPIRHRLGDAS